MNPFPNHIIINGEKIEIETFLEETRQPEYLKKLGNFLKEWYSPADFIEVNTSGSTGKPKTIQLTKAFVAQSARRTLEFFNLQPKDRILHCLPMDYIAGKVMVIRALAGLLDLVPVEPSTDFSFLKREHFRFAAMVPHQTARILNQEGSPGQWLNQIQILLLGGSAIPHELDNQLQHVGTACYSGYAMTETATHIALRKINDPGKDPFYRCLNQIRVGLSDDGCLHIFAPGIDEQPLQTTDLAELIDDKTFRITGRKDNIIISGGLKFSPEVLEEKLESLINKPFIISSEPHPTLGQELILVIEGSESPMEEKRLREICTQRLTRYEQPRKIRFIDQLPKTANGKIARNEHDIS